MAREKVQLYIKKSSKAYIKKVQEERIEIEEDDVSLSAIAAEMLDLGCKIHKLQNNTEHQESFNLEDFLKKVMPYILKASIYSKASFQNIESLENNKKLDVDHNQVNLAFEKLLSQFNNEFFDQSSN